MQRHTSLHPGEPGENPGLPCCQMATHWFCRKLFLAEAWGYDRWRRLWRNSAMIEFKGSHFEHVLILWGVRWYVAYPIS